MATHQRACRGLLVREGEGSGRVGAGAAVQGAFGALRAGCYCSIVKLRVFYVFI